MDLNDTIGKVIEMMEDSEQKAWEALAGYKFWMFGYHCGRWVNYNRLLPKSERRGNPFVDTVKVARAKIDSMSAGVVG